MNCLRNVAEKLGVENTRKHLIPYLTHLIIAEELSELKDLAVVFGDFEKYVGGSKYVHILLVRYTTIIIIKYRLIQRFPNFLLYDPF